MPVVTPEHQAKVDEATAYQQEVLRLRTEITHHERRLAAATQAMQVHEKNGQVSAQVSMCKLQSR